MSTTKATSPARRPLGQSTAHNTPTRVGALAKRTNSHASDDSFSAYLHGSLCSSSSASSSSQNEDARVLPPAARPAGASVAFKSVSPRARRTNAPSPASDALSSQGPDKAPQPSSTPRSPSPSPSPSPACSEPRSSDDRLTRLPASHAGLDSRDVTASAPTQVSSTHDGPPLYDGPTESQNHLSQSAIDELGASSSGLVPAAPRHADKANESQEAAASSQEVALSTLPHENPATALATTAAPPTRASVVMLSEDVDSDEDMLEDKGADEAHVVAADRGGAAHAGENDTGKKRRRRTNRAEANILASVFEQTAFPDVETRNALAERLNMTTRSVSIWFQNRRQTMKRRAARFGGPEGVAGLRPSEHSFVPVGSHLGVASAPGVKTEPGVDDGSSVKMLDAAPAREAPRTIPFAPPSGVTPARESQLDLDANVEAQSRFKDLRDLLAGRGTLRHEGRTLHRSASLGTLAGPRPVLSRKPSLNDVMQAQPHRDGAGLDGGSSKGAPSLSLTITMEGRASLGGVSSDGGASDSHDGCAALERQRPSLLASVFRKPGIVTAQTVASSQRPGASQLWERMESSSSSSDPVQAFHGPNIDQGETRSQRAAQIDVEGEEDEERTLKLIAQRRAARASAKAAAPTHADLATADRETPALEESSITSPRESARPEKGRVISLLRPRHSMPSLDLAAGRDRASGTIREGGESNAKRPRFTMDYDWTAMQSQVHARQDVLRKREQEERLKAQKHKERQEQLRLNRQQRQQQQQHQHQQQQQGRQHQKMEIATARRKRPEKRANPAKPGSSQQPGRAISDVDDFACQQSSSWSSRAEESTNTLVSDSSHNAHHLPPLSAMLDPSANEWMHPAPPIAVGGFARGMRTLSTPAALYSASQQRYRASSLRGPGAPIPMSSTFVARPNLLSAGTVAGAGPLRMSSLNVRDAHAGTMPTRHFGRHLSGGTSESSLRLGAAPAPQLPQLGFGTGLPSAYAAGGPPRFERRASSLTRSASLDLTRAAQRQEVRTARTSGAVLVGKKRNARGATTTTASDGAASSSGRHDDSGFFDGSGGGGSSDEENVYSAEEEEDDAEVDVRVVASRGVKGAPPPKRRRAVGTAGTTTETGRAARGVDRGERERSSSTSPTKAHPDRQAAELLLGLGREG